MDRLKNELMEEGEDSNTLDYAEFETCMKSFGIDEHFDQKSLHKIFTHFVHSQSASSTSKYLHKRKELNIELFCKYLGDEVQNHVTMQPREILDYAFRQLLETEIGKSHKGSHKNILLDTINLADADVDATLNAKPNPYLDANFMGDITKDYGPDKIAKFEKEHSVKDSDGLMVKEEAKIVCKASPPSNSPIDGKTTIDLFGNVRGSAKGKTNEKKRSGSHGQLVRLDSSLKWKKEEFDKQEDEMKRAFELLAQQNEAVSKHNELGDSMRSTPKIGTIHEDQDIE